MSICLSYSTFATDLIIKNKKMKKTLLSVCAILFASLAFAQQARLISTELHFDESKHSNFN